MENLVFNRSRAELLDELKTNCSGKSRFNFNTHSQNIDAMMDLGTSMPEVFNTMEAIELSLVVIQQKLHPENKLKIYQHAPGIFMIFFKHKLTSGWLPLALTKEAEIVEPADGRDEDWLPNYCEFYAEI